MLTELKKLNGIFYRGISQTVQQCHKGSPYVMKMNPSGLFGREVFVQVKMVSRIWTHQKTLSRCYSVRRALYFVPGNDINSLTTALKLKVDSIAMDCESGVPIDQKDKARQNIRDLLDSGPVTANDPEWCVRINPVQTPKLCEADINILFSARNLPITVCLPKVKNVNQLEWFTEKVWKTLLQRPEDDRGPVKLMMQIDSASAMLALPELCQKAEDLSTMAPVVPDCLIFDSDSVLDSLGARRTMSGIEVLYARQKLVLVAKAFGLQAIDKPFFNIKSFNGLKECCADGVILGFNGKQVIHMDQIVITQEEFTPSRSKIHWAKSVLKTHRENKDKEEEDFGFENSLVDNASLKQAENILNAARAAGLEIESVALVTQENQDGL